MGTCVGSEKGVLNSVSTLFSEAVTAEQSEHRCLWTCGLNTVKNQNLDEKKPVNHIFYFSIHVVEWLQEAGRR